MLLRTLALTILASLTLSVAATRAHADDPPPIALIPFTGPHADEAQAVVEKALGERVTKVTAETLAEHAGSVVVSGIVQTRGKKFELVINALTVAGDLVGQLAYPLKGRHMSPSQLKQLATDIERLVANAPPLPSQRKPAGPMVEQAQDAEKVALDVRPKRDPVTRAIVEPKPPRPPRPVWAPLFEVGVGGLISSRRLSFSPPQSPSLRPGIAGGVYADATIYPLAFLHDKVRGVLSGLGLGATVIAPFWPTTRIDDSSGARYSTKELSIEGSIRWKFALRKIQPRVDLTVIGGGGIHTFNIGQLTPGQDVGPPDARYVYTTFGVQGRVHVREWVSVLAAFQASYVPDAGPIEDRERYGLADTYMLKARVGVDFRVWRGMRVGALGYWERYAMKFLGTPGVARVARSATDQYFGGVLFVSYSM